MIQALKLSHFLSQVPVQYFFFPNVDNTEKIMNQFLKSCYAHLINLCRLLLLRGK
jgi:hypothetical protein